MQMLGDSAPKNAAPKRNESASPLVLPAWPEQLQVTRLVI